MPRIIFMRALADIYLWLIFPKYIHSIFSWYYSCNQRVLLMGDSGKNMLIKFHTKELLQELKSVEGSRQLLVSVKFLKVSIDCKCNQYALGKFKKEPKLCKEHILNSDA